jgi:predicted transcriptional regulator
MEQDSCDSDLLAQLETVRTNGSDLAEQIANLLRSEHDLTVFAETEEVGNSSLPRFCQSAN